MAFCSFRDFPAGMAVCTGMEHFTARDRRILAIALAAILLASAAAIGTLSWSAVIVAKAAISGAQAIFGA